MRHHLLSSRFESVTRNHPRGRALVVEAVTHVAVVRDVSHRRVLKGVHSRHGRLDSGRRVGEVDETVSTLCVVCLLK
jgi:hypothetical protein